MIPLSKAVMGMSRYDRTNQELKWYNEPIYLCTTEWHMNDEIEAECKRRKIPYEGFFVKERSTDKDKVQSQGTINYDQEYNGYDERFDYHMYKIKLGNWKTSGLEKKQMADWAITTFNDKEGPIFPEDLISYGVWIQPSREVSVDRDSYDEDGLPRSLTVHWV